MAVLLGISMADEIFSMDRIALKMDDKIGVGCAAILLAADILHNQLKSLNHPQLALDLH